ncbi:serine/threonine-protein kinase [Streptomyces sp. DH8]|uniref:serine/threonine-protein kinase n=1 Tax=Streptomyces sp. DH8 TaxID=2857008 RepID=UPI001E2EA5D2|nr:serine/threonine-protein kinase [Streptomyces sp. DH8]
MQALGPDDPAQVGPFRTVAVLGQGGMGRVLLAAAGDGRLVAVKRVHADLAHDEGFRARFRREVDASRRVSGAYTAPVVDADPGAPAPWLASLFLPGPTLGEALEAVGVLPEEAVRQLASGLARALADVHRAGLVHRDLKPSNVLLTEDGVRVIDFGIARAVDHATRITHTGALIGSPAFMAPEQIEGADPGPAADVFALGATLALACAGRPPFSGASVPAMLYAVVHEEPGLTAVPPGLRDVVAACLAKDPALRPSPQEVSARIGSVPAAARPWPQAVYDRITAQRAEAERLVVHTAPTIAPPPGPRPAPPPAPLPVSPPGPRPAPLPVSPPGRLPAPPPTPVRAPAPTPRRRVRRGRIAAAVVAGLLVVTGAVGAATGWAADLFYLVVPEPVPTPGDVPLDRVADRYTGAPADCAHVFDRVEAPAGFTALRPPADPDRAPAPRHDGRWSEQCMWSTASEETITIAWDQYDSADGRTGAERAKEHYEEFYRRGITSRDADLGFVEEGLWERPGDRCVLRGRDGNLNLFVVVERPARPLDGCESVAEETGRQFMAAVKAW